MLFSSTEASVNLFTPIFQLWPAALCARIFASSALKRASRTACSVASS